MINIKNIQISELLKVFLLGLSVVIVTFPENDWSYSDGIDGPLFWVFNNIYRTGLNIGQHIIFPHGPLAFFMYPLQENIIIVRVITSLLKILLVFNIYWLTGDKGSYRWFIPFVLAYLISIIGAFNQLLLANIILLYCNYYNFEKSIYKLTAFILTAFAFYVKSYVAITSGVLCFSFISYYFLLRKNYIKTGFDILTIFGLLLLFWFFMYGTFFGFITYITGLFQLAQDNSSAAAYYPYNNWWILSAFFVAIFAIPFINKTRESNFYSVLVLLSLFAAWKHGMAREDIIHARGFLIYVLIVLFIFIIFNKTKIFRNLTLSFIIIVLLSINLKNSVFYYSSEYKLIRSNNFIEFVSEFSNLKSKATNKIKKKTSGNILSLSIMNSIKDATVDIYPWDYSIISANKLNWQPRIVIQSYASYTSWLDKKNAEHFKSSLAPEFFIWKRYVNSKDINGVDYNSLDYRYLLNDEPQTIVQLLRNYKFHCSENEFLVLKKRTIPLSSNSSIIEKNSLQWGEWVNVPESNNNLLRVKLEFEKSLLQRLKSFLYKDEQFWIYLKLQNGAIHKYRIVPKNAKDGIWINPYISHVSKASSIEKIMFRCSNRKIMSENINIEWEKYEFEKEPNCVFNFFDASYSNQDSIVESSVNNFEELKKDKWTDIKKHQLSNISYLGSQSFLLTQSYSAAYSYAMDSLSCGNITVVADCWVKSPNYKYTNNASLVLSIYNENGHVKWKGLSIDLQLIDQNHWNHVSCYIKHNNVEPNCTLKAFIENGSNKEIYIDNFRVQLIKN